MVLRNWIKGRLRGGCESGGVRHSGALPYSIVNQRVVFLLVTSRRTGRWIFPKGSVSSGLTPWDSAAKEALEEAGVTGTISSVPTGSYQNSDKGVLVDIDLYPLLVENQLDEWREKDQRLRHWALLAEVLRLIEDRSISRIAVTLEHDLKKSGVVRPESSSKLNRR